jgi:hypothetical protein
MKGTEISKHKETTGEGRIIHSSSRGESRVLFNRSIFHEPFDGDTILIRRYTPNKFTNPLINFEQHVIAAGNFISNSHCLHKLQIIFIIRYLQFVK